jgi:hypothetical protein
MFLPWILLVFVAGLNIGLNLSQLYPASPFFHAALWKVVLSVVIAGFAMNMIRNKKGD